VKRLLSSDHFSVDGTLIEAWASIKSFRRKDERDRDGDGPGRNAERNFHGEQRSNETHESTTDPEARLYRKGDGQPARLCYMGHALMENRHGLAVAGVASLATGTAERETALELLDRRQTGHRITLGADKAYDVMAFIGDLRSRAVTPHIAVDGHITKTGKQRRTAIDGRTTRHAGYEISQRCRKRIEEVVRLDQELGRSGQGKGARTRPRPCRLHLGAGSLQLDPPSQAPGGAGMTVRGKWRIVETPDHDMARPGAYILFDKTGGEFVFDCLTGSIHSVCDGNAVEFSWAGNDEMEPASGTGWAELQDDGSLEGEISLDNGDDVPFIARRQMTSSTAC